MLDSFKEYLKSFISEVFTSFDTMLADSVSILSGTSGLPDAWSSMGDIANLLKPLCLCMLALTLMMEIAQTAMKMDMIKWEMLLKTLLKMVIAKVAIDNCRDLLNTIYLTAVDWMDKVQSHGLSGSTGIGASSYSKIESFINGLTGWGPVLGLFISLLIILLAVKICGVVVMAMAYGRMFEIYLLLAVSPVAFAFLPMGEGGFGGMTMKFIKSFTATCLQGVLMILCIKLYGVLMNTLLMRKVTYIANHSTGVAGVMGICFVMLLGAIVLIMAILKCGSLSKQVMNAM